MGNLAQYSDYAASCGTVCGIINACSPIIPFIQIMRGKEKAKTFPESMIILGIFCSELWMCYWLAQYQFIAFFSAAFGVIMATIFGTIYCYFYFGNKMVNWFVALAGQFGLIALVYYLLMKVIPLWVVGKGAMVIGVLLNVAPGQNVVKVCKEGNYKLIPIWSTLFGGLNTTSWLVFGLMLGDINSIVPNGLSLAITIANASIWLVFYLKSSKKDEKQEKLKDEEA